MSLCVSVSLHGFQTTHVHEQGRWVFSGSQGFPVHQLPQPKSPAFFSPAAWASRLCLCPVGGTHLRLHTPSFPLLFSAIHAQRPEYVLVLRDPLCCAHRTALQGKTKGIPSSLPLFWSLDCPKMNSSPALLPQSLPEAWASLSCWIHLSVCGSLPSELAWSYAIPGVPSKIEPQLLPPGIHGFLAEGLGGSSIFPTRSQPVA